MDEYLTDGERLYEVAWEDLAVNSGLGGSILRSVVLRDCATGYLTELLHGAQLFTYTPVARKQTASVSA